MDPGAAGQVPGGTVGPGPLAATIAAVAMVPDPPAAVAASVIPTGVVTGVAVAGGRVCPVHWVPSHHRWVATPQGSPYQPGGAAEVPADCMAEE